LKIEVYNEAGELVREIAETEINKPVREIEMKDKFTSGEEELIISIPGIWTPEENGEGVERINFKWEGKNENGQWTGQGIYYIKVSVKDPYGHTEATVKEVSQMRREEYMRVNIYNTGGELVAGIEKREGIMELLDINLIKDIIYIGEGGGYEFNVGGSNIVNWDGKTGEGKRIANGIYEIQVKIKTKSGVEKIASKTVTIFVIDGKKVLIDPENPASFPRVYPNPVVMETEEGEQIIEWYRSYPGEIKIKIYNISGELVYETKGNLNNKYIKWDLNTKNGMPVSSGLYIIVLQAKKITGEEELSIIKSAVIRKSGINENIN
jgi:flagellar hook assembly protein FlgD